jgi:hypothetical protein
MRVLVKGTAQEAETAALARGMRLQPIRELPTYCETLGEVSDTFRPELIKWFCEDTVRPVPYPVGSLLMYWEPNHAE